MLRYFQENHTFPPGAYFALIIYVNEYQDNSLNLDYPNDDAQNLRKVLREYYHFDEINVLSNPNRAQLLDALAELRRHRENDNLLIFFAGHGSYDEAIDQGYWLPSDARPGSQANWISNSDIRDQLKGIKARHILLISDACFSGGIFKTRAVDYEERTFQAKYQYPSRRAITSGVLKEVPDKSVFLQYLVQRLKENENPYLGALDLFARMRDAVMNNTHNTPQYGVIYDAGDQGGEFIFIRKVFNSLPKSRINSVGMNLQLIKPGSFSMGSHGGRDDEKPVRLVHIKRPFYMGSTEVTQAQYEAVMGVNPSHFKGSNLPVGNSFLDRSSGFYAPAE